MLDSQDQELLSILEELQIPDHNLLLERSVNISATRITGYFCFDTVFTLSNRVLTDLEIQVLEKGLDFALIQRKLMNKSYNKILQIFKEECTQS